jgi:hypothetical protein
MCGRVPKRHQEVVVPEKALEIRQAIQRQKALVIE